MSSDDILRDAISAARGQAEDGADDGAATRLRIRESLANRGVANRKRFTLIAAVIASLVGSTAFAYWSGWRPPWSRQEPVVAAPDDDSAAHVSMRLPDAHRSGKRDEGVVEAPAVAPSDVTVGAPETAPAPVASAGPPATTTGPSGRPQGVAESSRTERESPSTTAQPVAPTLSTPSTPSIAPATPATTTARPTPTPRAPSIAPATPATTTARPTPTPSAPSIAPATPATTTARPTPTPTTARPTPTPTTPTPSTSQPPTTASAPRVTASAPRLDEVHPDPELAAYGRAHNLHFRGGDPKAALAAWDAYLAAYPDGKLALEARYDRALVLVKLARWAEARAALTPFATAAAGSYRQVEAAQILAAIRDR